MIVQQWLHYARWGGGGGGATHKVKGSIVISDLELSVIPYGEVETF